MNKRFSFTQTKFVEVCNFCGYCILYSEHRDTSLTCLPRSNERSVALAVEVDEQTDRQERVIATKLEVRNFINRQWRTGGRNS